MAVHYYVNTDRLELLGSEAMQLAAIGLEHYPKFGITLDEAAAVTTFPQVQIPRTKEATQQLMSSKDMTTSWAAALLAGPEVRQRGRSPFLQVVHVPHELAQPADDDTLDQLIRLSVGWNYLQMVAEGFMTDARESLRGALTSAQALVSY